MPLPTDDNMRAVQVLHPIACHILNLVAGDWTATAAFLMAEVLAVELQPENDTVIRFGEDGPSIYLRGNGYFVYDTRKYGILYAKPAPTADPGLLVVTEMG